MSEWCSVVALNQWLILCLFLIFIKMPSSSTSSCFLCLAIISLSALCSLCVFQTLSELRPLGILQNLEKILGFCSSSSLTLRSIFVLLLYDMFLIASSMLIFTFSLVFFLFRNSIASSEDIWLTKCDSVLFCTRLAVVGGLVSTVKVEAGLALSFLESSVEISFQSFPFCDKDCP